MDLTWSLSLAGSFTTRPRGPGVLLFLNLIVRTVPETIAGNKVFSRFSKDLVRLLSGACQATVRIGKSLYKVPIRSLYCLCNSAPDLSDPRINPSYIRCYGVICSKCCLYCSIDKTRIGLTLFPLIISQESEWL